MYNQKNIHRKILIRLSTLIVIVGIIIYFTIDSATKLHATVLQINDIKERAALVRTETDASVSLLTVLNNIEGNMLRIYDALPAHDYIVPAVDRIEALALEHNLVLKSDWGNPTMSNTRLPSITHNKQQHQLYTVAGSLRLEGNAQSFEYFLIALEALPYFMQIHKIKAVAQDDTEWENAAVFTLEINLVTMQK